MKIREILLCVCLTVGLGSAKAEPQDSIPGNDLPFLKFESSELDMGIVEPDGVSEREITFSNEGNSPLVLTDVFTQCGCTVASFPKDTIAPGMQGKIHVKFNARGRSAGNFKKIVRVRSNASNAREFFYVKGIIKRKYMR